MLLHLLSTLIFSAAVAAGSANSAPPNVVIIYADDLGYGDLGCQGHPTIRTPNLDRMAQEGMRFTDFHSAAEVCTPSRASLLTGRYAMRSGMCHDKFRVLRRQSTGHLPLDEITIPELLKEKGYATAIIGKWHLSVWSNVADAHPSRHGFDFVFGLPHSNDMDPAPGNPPGAPGRLDQDPEWWQAPLYRNREIVEQPADQSTLTKRYTEEAVKFIKEKKDGPFFLYLPHTFPHVPLFASGSFHGHSARGIYGDAVEEIDWSVGEILATLQAEGLEKHTMVLFTSDNGPWLIMGLAGGSSGLLRDGKGSTWEGGMRVPAIAWWPGTVPEGRVCRETASTLDLLPTIAGMAGVETPADRVLDGVDILPLLKGGAAPERDNAFIYYRGSTLFAARAGKWKVHYFVQAGYGQPKPEPQDPPLLFDLEADPGESRNVAAQHPDILQKIAAAVEKHRAGVVPVPTQLEGTTP